MPRERWERCGCAWEEGLSVGAGGWSESHLSLGLGLKRPRSVRARGSEQLIGCVLDSPIWSNPLKMTWTHISCQEIFLKNVKHHHIENPVSIVKIWHIKLKSNEARWKRNSFPECLISVNTGLWGSWRGTGRMKWKINWVKQVGMSSKSEDLVTISKIKKRVSLVHSKADSL